MPFKWSSTLDVRATDGGLQCTGTTTTTTTMMYGVLVLFVGQPIGQVESTYKRHLLMLEIFKEQRKPLSSAFFMIIIMNTVRYLCNQVQI